MIVVSIVLLTCVALTYCQDVKMLSNGMKISFMLLIFVFSLRYGYGNDYFVYKKIFDEITSHYLIEEAIANSMIENGWTIFTYLFKLFGFDAFILVHTLCCNISMCYLINKYVPEGYRWLSVFIYLFLPTLFLLNLSMMRQGLAAILLLLVVDSILDKKIIKMFVFTILAISIHNTSIIAVIVIPIVYLIKYIDIRYILITLTIFIVILWIYPDMSFILISFAFNNETISDNYSNYFAVDGSETSIGIGFLLRVLALFPCFVYIKKGSIVSNTFLVLYMLNYIFLPLSFQMLLLSRFSCYFILFAVIMYPIWYKIIPNLYLRLLSMFSLVLYSVFSYIQFFYSPTYGSSYRIFKTILFNY